MKAAIFKSYGPPEVLTITEVAKPKIKKNDILVKIQYSTVTAGDCELRRFDIQNSWKIFVAIFMGFPRPRKKILGQDFAGVVEEVGSSVKNFKVGDKVFGPSEKLGCYSEYQKFSARGPILKAPNEIALKELACLGTGGLNALHFMRLAEIKPGDKMVINGAGGSIGTYALQIARNQGALVDCIDSPNKHKMLRELGAQKTFGFENEKLWDRKVEYDIVFDVAGKDKLSDLSIPLKNGGRLIDSNPSISGFFYSKWKNIRSSKKIIPALASYSSENLELLLNWMLEGSLKSAIDKVMPISQIKEGHEYVEKGMKCGNLLIEMKF